jgi:hypothetical protein
MAAIPHGA